mmetsp:Transcript_39954/g.106900  ORF Transcript_39954/g.106900 Transcript_39954/m.106900 type:complete len:217 (-) Transcript_39954:474-1124(-)
MKVASLPLMDPSSATAGIFVTHVAPHVICTKVTKERSNTPNSISSSSPNRVTPTLAYMLAMMKRIIKALIMGTMDSASGRMTLRSAETRPKSRTTRTARRILMALMLVAPGPRELSEQATTKMSIQFHPLVTKGRNQWARALMTSSTVKNTVNIALARLKSMALAQFGDLSRTSRIVCISATVVAKLSTMQIRDAAWKTLELKYLAASFWPRRYRE